MATARRDNDNGGDGATDNNVNNDCDGAMNDDVRRDGQQPRRDVDGDGITSNNDDDDGNLGLGERLLPPSSLPTPRSVGG